MSSRCLLQNISVILPMFSKVSGGWGVVAPVVDPWLRGWFKRSCPARTRPSCRTRSGRSRSRCRRRRARLRPSLCRSALRQILASTICLISVRII